MTVSVVDGLHVDVTFSEAMGSGVTVASNYTVSNAGRGSLAVNPVSAVLSSGNTYRLSWSSGEMVNGANVTITVDPAVKDAAGNGMGSVNYGTGTGIGVLPAVQAVSVADDLHVDVTFSEAMGSSALTASNYTLSGTGRGTLSAAPSSVAVGAGNTYRLAWSTGEMRDGGDITVTVGVGALDVAGNPVGTPNSGTDAGGGMGVAPVFSGYGAVPSPAKLGTVVTLTYSVSEALSGNPAVTVNGHGASYVSHAGMNYTYSYTVQGSDAEGLASISVSGSDLAGNPGSGVNTTVLRIDKTAPVVTVTTQVTGDTTPLLSGTVTDDVAVAGVQVTVGTHTYTAVLGSGTWTAQVTDVLAQNTYNVVAQATDTAGNIGTDATADELTVDLNVPIVTVAALETTDTTPLLSGTAAPQAGHSVTLVEVTVDGQTYTGVLVGTAWTAQVTAVLADGVYDVQVMARDDLGREGTDGTTDELTVDTAGPVATIVLTDVNPTVLDVLHFGITFDEDVNGTFTQEDVALAAGSLDGGLLLEGSGTAYTVTVSLTDGMANGTVALEILGGGAVSDALGNPGAGGTSEAYTVHNWPGFTEEPEDARVYVGGSHTFRVSADYGPVTPTFQWKFDDGLKAVQDGPETEDWPLLGVLENMAGEYWCEVGYGGETYASAHAALGVAPELTLSFPLENAVVDPGASHTFTVAVTGGFAPLSYHWYHGEDLITTADNLPDYTVPGAGEEDTGAYTVRVFDDNGAMVESTAELSLSGAMPAAGLIGLLLMTAALGAAGTALRRKK
ncbi:MAG TPA: Ig-like domain-containing protein [Candidatus Hydrogenedentes bacterium]|nr:Ig-like domain-containing protein [Candidatus Hydrogenedentota bacterium]